MDDISKWLSDSNNLNNGIRDSMNAIYAITRKTSAMEGTLSAMEMATTSSRAMGGAMSVMEAATRSSRVMEGAMDSVYSLASNRSDLTEMYGHVGAIDRATSKASEMYTHMWSFDRTSDTMAKMLGYIGAVDRTADTMVKMVGHIGAFDRTADIMAKMHGRMESFDRTASSMTKMLGHIGAVDGTTNAMAEMFGRTTSFSKVVKTFSDISDTDISRVNELIVSDQNLHEIIQQAVSVGVEIALSNLASKEKTKKLDEYFYNFFAEITSHIGISRQTAYIIAGVIWIVILMAAKKPFENLVYGDSSKAVVSNEKKIIPQIDEKFVAISTMNAELDKKSKHIDSGKIIYGITTRNCILRSRNDSNSDSLSQVNANTRVAIVSDNSPRWYKVLIAIDSNKVYGFVSKRNVTVQ